MSRPQYFRPRNPLHYSVMGTALVSLIGALNIGRTGELPVAVHASRRGYRITVAGRTIAKGRTPEELHDNFQAAIAKAAGRKP